jgi:hypothetical protein
MLYAPSFFAFSVLSEYLTMLTYGTSFSHSDSFPLRLREGFPLLRLDTFDTYIFRSFLLPFVTYQRNIYIESPIAIHDVTILFTLETQSPLPNPSPSYDVQLGT